MQTVQSLCRRAPVTIHYFGNELPLWRDIEPLLRSVGHVRLRGSSFKNSTELDEKYGYLIQNKTQYLGGSSYRDSLSNNVLNTGYEPPYMDLEQHYEMSYTDQWPQLFMLGCIENTVKSGGMTTISNNKRVTENLPTDLYNKYMDLGIKYIRNEVDKYDSNIPSDMRSQYQTWQKSFMTESKEAVENVCGNNGYKHVWTNDNRLYYEYNRPFFVYHPIYKDEMVLFASFVSGVNWYEKRGIFADIPGEKRPFHCQWGNGTEFTESEKQTMDDLYNEFLMGDKWESGDILLLDNHFTTHGRSRYEIQEGTSQVRNIGVMMGNKTIRSDLTQFNGIAHTHQQQ